MQSNHLQPAQNKPTKEISLYKIAYYFFQLRDKLSADGGATVEHIKYITQQWNNAIQQILQITESIGKEISQMDDNNNQDDKNSPNLNTSWHAFQKHMTMCVETGQTLSRSLSDAKSDEKTIACNAQAFLTSIPQLLTSFDGLQLNTKIQSFLPGSFTELKNSFNDFIKSHIQNILPAHFEKQIKEYLSSTLMTAEEFAKQSPEEQNLKLVAMEELITILREIFIGLDKTGIKLSVKQGYILDRKIDILNNNSFNQVCKSICDTYSSYMNAAGYSHNDRVELHPFSASVNQQRLAMTKPIDKQISDKKEYEKNQLEAKKHALQMIEEECIRLNKKNGMFNKAQIKLGLLNKLKTKIEKDNLNLNDSLKKLHDEKSDLLTIKSESLSKLISKLRERFAQAELMEQQRIATLTHQKNRILKRLPNNLLDIKAHIQDEKRLKASHVITHLSTKTIPQIELSLTELKTTLSTILTGDKAKPNDKKQLNANEIIHQLDEQLKGILDPNLYNQLFKIKKITRLDVKHVANNHNQTVWIEHLANLFHDLKMILPILCHEKVIYKKANNPAESLIRITEEREKAVTKLIHIIQSIIQLQQDPFIQQFTSLTGIKSFISHTINPLKNHVNSLPIQRDEKSNIGIIARLKDLNTRLAERYQIEPLLKNQFIEFSTHLENFVESSSRLTADPLHVNSNTELFSFAYNNFNTISQLITKASLAVKLISHNSKQLALEIIQEINLFLKDFYLMLDKLEIQFHLKEGFLKNFLILGNHSFASFVTHFHQEIANAGYTFKNEDDYPYTEAVLETRHQMLLSTSSSFEKQILEKRINNLTTQANITNNIKNTVNKLNEIHDKKASQHNVTKQLEERIQELDSELKTSVYTRTKLNKKHILTKLKNIHTNFACLNDAIAYLATQPDTKDQIHQLHEGRTGKLIQELTYANATRSDLLNKIDIAIEALIKKREETYYINAASRKQSLENKIFALNQLRNNINKSGYTVIEALNNIDQASNNILLHEENTLLRQLNVIDQHILPTKRPKKIIDSTPIIMKDTPDIYNYAVKLISERLKNLRAAFLQTTTVTNKITLVNCLAIKLHQGVALSKALEEIHNEYPQINYLLFEGRTGVMMKSIHLFALSKADTLHRSQKVEPQNNRIPRWYSLELYSKDADAKKLDIPTCQKVKPLKFPRKSQA